MEKALIGNLPFDPSTGPGRLVATAEWTSRLPHEGTLSITLLPEATDPAKRQRLHFERTVSLPGFRRGAAYLPRAYVEAEWERLEAGIVQSLAHEAVSLLKPHLGTERGAPTSASEWGKDLLSPLPEVLSHTDPLSPDTPLTLTLRLTLQPAPPDPLQSDTVWPPDPALEAMRQATAANKEAPMPTPSSIQPPATAPAYPGVPPPPPGVPAAGPGHSPLPTHVPALPTHPRPQPHSTDPGGF